MVSDRKQRRRLLLQLKSNAIFPRVIFKIIYRSRHLLVAGLLLGVKFLLIKSDHYNVANKISNFQFLFL